MIGFTTFTDPNRIHGNVLLNWQKHAVGDIVAFAVGYKNAAQRLVASLEGAITYPDHSSYPILFLYRHALELYLKALTYRAAQLQMIETELGVALPRLWSEHSLSRLLRMAAPILSALATRHLGRRLSMLVEDVNTLVCEVNAIDPGSYAFRYPITSTGQATIPHHTIINVLLFAERVDRTLDDLNGACIYLNQRFASTVEMKQALASLLSGNMNAT